MKKLSERAGANDLLKANEVAKLWRVHVETVRRAVREKRMRGSKMGRHWRIRRSELERIEKKGAV